MSIFRTDAAAPPTKDPPRLRAPRRRGCRREGRSLLARLVTLLPPLAAAILAASAAAVAQGRGDAPPPSVVVAPVQAQEVGRSDQFIGRIQAIQSVDLKARVEGFLEKVNFTEGAFVNADDVLYEIEKAPYQAAVAQAQAQVAAAQAAIAGAKASLKNAQTNLDRQLDLVKRGTVSQAVADDAQAQRDLAAAKVQSAEAELQQARAQLQAAELDLSYTTITAPIDGRIGATNVTEGNLVNPQTGTLATVVQVDPIRVAFSIPESLYVTFAEADGQDIRDQAEGIFEPTLELPTGKPYGETGRIAFASNRIDPATGSLVVYADFPNGKGVLLPGSFVNVTVQESRRESMPVVPAPAVLQDRQGQYVFVVNDDDRAERRRITSTARVRDGFAVSSGLQVGETVVVSGVQKVRPGEKVRPTAQPSSPATVAQSNAANGASAPSSGTGRTPGDTASDAGGPPSDGSSAPDEGGDGGAASTAAASGASN